MSIINSNCNILYHLRKVESILTVRHLVLVKEFVLAKSLHDDCIFIAFINREGCVIIHFHYIDRKKPLIGTLVCLITCFKKLKNLQNNVFPKVMYQKVYRQI